MVRTAGNRDPASAAAQMACSSFLHHNLAVFKNHVVNPILLTDLIRFAGPKRDPSPHPLRHLPANPLPDKLKRHAPDDLLKETLNQGAAGGPLIQAARA